MNFFRSRQFELSRFRINALYLGIFFLMALLLGRIFYLQVIKHDYYLNLGLSQRSITRSLSAERGGIFALAGASDQGNLYPLAVNNVYYEVSLDPSKITRPQNISDIIAQVLGLSDQEKEDILTKAKREGRFYELVAREISQEKADELVNRLDELLAEVNDSKDDKDKLKSISELGVNFRKHILRLYPDKEVGAHILGFLGYDNEGVNREGKYGLESYFERDLAGFGGKVSGEKDVAGRLMGASGGAPVQDGADLVLTIDRAVQYFVCKALERGVARYQAKSGTVIVMETESGAVRAMCNYPSFDPNEYSKVESGEVYNNLAVYDAYEPGSVMKSIAMAIAIDQGKVTPNTIYNDEGEVKFAGGFVVRNSDRKAHGIVDMKEVLASSLNTGIIFSTFGVNNKIFEEYMQKFGFGALSGIMLSQEGRGNISSLARQGDIYKATASYGQGITVTPIQMVAAINAIANKGEFVKPYLVEEIRYSNGEIRRFYPETLRRVISRATATQIAAMMVYVIDTGHSRTAGVEGYYVAGKTGTAQVANPETGRYYTDRTIHNIVGFAPSGNPKFSLIVKLDYPQAGAFAESTAAHIFGEISKFLLEYYQIAPER
ncbi:MAG: penicillin-binding protein 2 [Patescibacteria group bacterium]|nr:penicillin-binding protein 2 [Patescibacteria group bacterium]